MMMMITNKSINQAAGRLTCEAVGDATRLIMPGRQTVARLAMPTCSWQRSRSNQQHATVYGRNVISITSPPPAASAAAASATDGEHGALLLPADCVGRDGRRPMGDWRPARRRSTGSQAVRLVECCVAQRPVMDDCSTFNPFQPQLIRQFHASVCISVFAFSLINNNSNNPMDTRRRNHCIFNVEI